PGGPPRDAVLAVRYTVRDAALVRARDIDLRVPVLLPAATAIEAGDDFFRAELSAPAALAVVESFPTVAPSADVAPAGVHAMRLPAAPSLLRWRLSAEPRPLTVAHTVDFALAALLAILGLL